MNESLVLCLFSAILMLRQTKRDELRIRVIDPTGPGVKTWAIKKICPAHYKRNLRPENASQCVESPCCRATDLDTLLSAGSVSESAIGPEANELRR